jgi:2-polyprenyl-3-methyl-5-hydroxy-6-metoxy-1,4-benzoquinol methylase|tara:strand:- start:1284 stop:1997 length:714 start_codon:yes stop_codon:yes gene_type:complete
MYKPNEKLPGKFSINDGTLDFYLRVRTIINKKKIVLDLGAGKGVWFQNKNNIELIQSIQYLKPHVKKLYGADMDPIILRNKSTDENLLIKNNIIPLKNSSIDIIICDWVFEHIQYPKIFYKEINRVLKRNGTLCLRTPHKFSYMSLISNLLEGSIIKDWLLKKTQPGRKKYFRSFYKINTQHKINKVFKNYSNNTFIIKPDPGYYFNSKIVYILLQIMHSITPKFFSGVIIGFLKKI